MPDTVLYASTCITSFNMFRLRVKIISQNGSHRKAYQVVDNNGFLSDLGTLQVLSALGTLHMMFPLARMFSPNSICMLLLFQISVLSQSHFHTI